MPQFKYSARSRSGEKLSGTVIASSKAAAADDIQRMGPFPIAIDPESGPVLVAENPIRPRILFPDKVQRLDYAARLIIWFIGVPVISAFLLPIPNFVAIPKWLPFVVIIALVPLRFPCADIPRFRSIGWSPWLVLLFPVPLLGLVVQLLLLFMPANPSLTM